MLGEPVNPWVKFAICTPFNSASQKTLPDPINVSIILDWTAEFDYNVTGNMSIMLQVNGTNCSTYQIERVAGDSVTVGGTCAYREDILPGTDYLINIFGQDSGGIVFLNVFSKEIRLETEELTLEAIIGSGVQTTVLRCSPCRNRF